MCGEMEYDYNTSIYNMLQGLYQRTESHSVLIQLWIWLSCLMCSHTAVDLVILPYIQFYIIGSMSVELDVKSNNYKHIHLHCQKCLV